LHPLLHPEHYAIVQDRSHGCDAALIDAIKQLQIVFIANMPSWRMFVQR
jgi:hypothetical protein